VKIRQGGVKFSKPEKSVQMIFQASGYVPIVPWDDFGSKKIRQKKAVELVLTALISDVPR
jgi:hypothetical protein